VVEVRPDSIADTLGLEEVVVISTEQCYLSELPVCYYKMTKPPTPR
jgi:hypothetical protein